MFDVGTKVLAAALLLSMLAGALHDVSRAWDVWYYHLPFAARLAGIVPADEFVFHPADQARFDGFPLLGEALQGLLWRITGRPESANLVAYAAVPLFAWFMRRALRVPWQLTVLALLAIPLVQIHATSAYVDLPANAAASVVVLLAIRAHATRAPLDAGALALAVLSAAVSANMKVMMGPIVLLALAALAVELLRQRWSARRRDKLAWAGAFALALVLVFATPLKNAALHGNPWYPVQVTALGVTFAGPEQPYSFAPAWLVDKPRVVRFVCSLLEIGLRPYSSTRRWTIDQFMPPDEPGSRLGGYFGAYVVAMVAALVVLVLRARSRRARVAALSFLAFTLLVSFMPQAHELRYYMCWMIVLVALVLWLARPEPDGLSARAPLDPRSGRWLYAVSVPALLVVVVVTHAECIYPSGVGFGELLREQVDEAALDRVHERVCIDRAPWNILWAARFHAPRRYVVYEAEGPADCRGVTALP